MKIAVISDIHGNLQALLKVVEDIEKEKCDKVLCLGDLAMAGPCPVMTLDFIVRNCSDWIIIQGNTDKLIAEYSLEIYDKMKKKMPVMADALWDDARTINKEFKSFLKNLPTRRELMLEGVSVLMVHGSPRRMNEDILPDMKLSEIEEMIEGETADLILCGHTHVPCGYQTITKKTVVNVGSVGRPMTGIPKANYAIFDFNQGSFAVEHKAIDYDYEGAAKMMRARGFDNCDAIADQLLVPVVRHL